MEDVKTIASYELLMEQLSNRNWDDFWVRLMGRCAWLLRKRYSVKWPNDKLQDFSRNAISEIIEKIFITKERNWNTEAYPEFEKFIVGALDSHVNNTLNKKNPEINVGDSEHLLKEETDTDQCTVIITGELRKEIFDQLQKDGADDLELLIFECLSEGIVKPEAIKEELNLSDEDFHNTWRRLKRKRDIIKKILAANGY